MSLHLRTLSGITLSERSGGRGTITLGASAGLYSELYGRAWPGMQRPITPSLELIPDAKNVYELLRRAQSTA